MVVHQSMPDLDFILCPPVRQLHLQLHFAIDKMFRAKWTLEVTEQHHLIASKFGKHTLVKYFETS